MDMLASLEGIVGDKGRVTDSTDILDKHSRDFAYHTPKKPDAVVFPKSTDEVAEILRFADANEIPVVPFGEGSSLEGSVVPVHGGVSLDFSLMDSVLEIRPDDFIARVEPGVTHGKLNEALEEHGLLFPVDPGWDASLGGMCGTNASGTNAVRYGVMRDQVLGMEVVLADGSIMRTGGLAMKSSAGYDLTNLFVGSEGTLGVFTEIALRLYPIPEKTVAARAVFESVEAAGRAAISMIRTGMRIGRVELVDEHTIKAVNEYKGTEYIEAPTLFLEFSGSEAGVESDVRKAREVSESENCRAFDFEADEVGIALLWEARHEAALAIVAASPGKLAMSTDVCVPVSELPEALRNARETIASRGVDGAILGHVGDGNYHAVFMLDPADENDLRRAKEVNGEIVRYALERGGTCTGEHGIGFGKKEYLEAEHGDSIPFMKKLKKMADPNGTLNPGKLF